MKKTTTQFLSISLAVLFFLMGSPSISFSAYPGECTYTYHNCTNIYAGHKDIGTNSGFDPPVWNDELHIWEKGIAYSKTAPFDYWQPTVTCGIVHAYWENNQWNYVTGQASYGTTTVMWFNPSSTFNFPTSPPPAEGCSGLPQDCDDEWNALVAQCGSESQIMNWDDQACTGECKPDCTEALNNLIISCGGRQYIDWFDDSTCLGECVSCEDIKDHCESMGFDTTDPNVYSCTQESFWETEVDTGGGIILGNYWIIGLDATESCSFDSGFDPEDPVPPDPPVDPPPDDPPADRPCDEIKADCIEACEGKVANFECTEGGTYHCECTNPPSADPTPDPGDPGDTPPDPGDDAPPGESGPGSTDPDGTNDNALLGDVVDNTRIIANNTKRIGDIAQTEFNELNASNSTIAERLKATNQWLSQIEEALQDGLDVDMDEVVDKLEEIQDIFSGEYEEISDEMPSEPYEPSEETFDIGVRFDTFLDRMGETSIFSIPNDLMTELPGGGTPVFTFEFGSYGTRSVDLSSMSQALLVLRTILLLSFAFVSIRVLVLKR